jgi:hypothetical protein
MRLPGLHHPDDEALMLFSLLDQSPQKILARPFQFAVRPQYFRLL